MGKIAHTILATLLLTNFSSASELKAARFALDNTDEFIAEKIALFAINKREFDPFGKPQDPNRKVVQKVIQKTAEPAIVEQKVLIQQEIDKLAGKINIFGKRFLHGSKSYRRNDQIVIQVKGKEFPLKVSSIRRDKVTFINLSDNSFVTLDLNKSSQPAGIGSPDSGPSKINSGEPDTIILD